MKRRFASRLVASIIVFQHRPSLPRLSENRKTLKGSDNNLIFEMKPFAVVLGRQLIGFLRQPPGRIHRPDFCSDFFFCRGWTLALKLGKSPPCRHLNCGIVVVFPPLDFLPAAPEWCAPLVSWPPPWPERQTASPQGPSPTVASEFLPCVSSFTGGLALGPNISCAHPSIFASPAKTRTPKKYLSLFSSLSPLSSRNHRLQRLVLPGPRR